MYLLVYVILKQYLVRLLFLQSRNSAEDIAMMFVCLSVCFSFQFWLRWTHETPYNYYAIEVQLNVILLNFPRSINATWRKREHVISELYYELFMQDPHGYSKNM
jgi:hypothetical protein